MSVLMSRTIVTPAGDVKIEVSPEEPSTTQMYQYRATWKSPSGRTLTATTRVHELELGAPGHSWEFVASRLLRRVSAFAFESMEIK